MLGQASSHLRDFISISSKSDILNHLIRLVIILMGKRELVALLNLSSCCLVMVGRLFLAVPWGFLLFVIVVFSDHTHYCNLYKINIS